MTQLASHRDERRESTSSVSEKRSLTLWNGLKRSRSQATSRGTTDTTTPVSESRHLDTWDTSSMGSNSSRSSRSSWVSAASASAKSRFSGLLGRSKTSTNGLATAQFSEDIACGDKVVTVTRVVLRSTDDVQSTTLTHLDPDVELSVLEVNGRRLRVRYDRPESAVEGWISLKTMLDEWLVQKKLPVLPSASVKPAIGARYEVKVTISVRAEADRESDVKAKLKPGTIVTIMDIHPNDVTFTKIAAPMIFGWARLLSSSGRPLVGHPSGQGRGADGVVFTPKYVKIRRLLEAAVQGDVESVRKALDHRGSTASLFASSSKKLDPNSTDVRGKTPLMYAAELGHRPLVEFLLSRLDVNVNAFDCTMKIALHHASKRGRERRPDEGPADQGEIVRTLIRRGAASEARDHNGCSALMFAAANGDEVVASVLIEARSDVNGRDFEGHTALDYAVHFGHDSIADLLRRHGGTGASEDDVESSASGDEGLEACERADGRPSVDDAPPLGGRGPLLPPPTGASVRPSAPVPVAGAAPESHPEVLPVVDADDCKETADELHASSGQMAAQRAAHKKVAKPAAKPKSGASKAATKAQGSGKKKAKKLAIATAGMLEAVAEEDCELKLVVEEGSDDTGAHTRLQQMLEATTTRGELKAALGEAERAGLDEAILAAARKRLGELAAQEQARDRLRRAKAKRDAAGLGSAIAEAEAAGVTGRSLTDAKKALKEFTRENAAP